MSGLSTRSADRDNASVAVATLWATYLLALPFHRVWVLPGLGLKLQPPDVVFLGLAAASALLWMRRGFGWRFAILDAAAAAWLATSMLAFAWSSEPRSRDGLLDTLSAAYLVGLYLAVRVTASPRLLDRFGDWFAYSAALAAALGIAGSLASSAGFANRLATAALTPVPYLGHAARAQAFTAGPQMLASILLMAIPLFVARRATEGWRRRDRALILLLVLGLGATFSKTAMCLVAALSVMWASAALDGQGQRSRRLRARVWMAAAIWSIVALTFVLGSHVMVLRQAAVPAMTTAQLVGGRPLASFRWRHEAWVVMPTTYLFNIEASLQAIRRAWPAGVGPAGQPAFTSRLQREGRFPGTIWIITPHSTYLGTAAERGAAGLAALLLILVAAGMTINRLPADSARLRWEAAAYAGVGAAFLIEAISTDLLNCRHYWFLLAVMAARLDSRARGGVRKRPANSSVAADEKGAALCPATAAHRDDARSGQQHRQHDERPF
ncbi:MAG: hypothetical protein A3G21_26240 [Acidobacteria bacterium RIFCSPLOWO2_12_FULL_66_21]|nr:MAG: hypothetical protein A3G21_26240 [Acidobacteria bacterium RIFCSPLOWO2_12_FULL_66_21]